MSDPDATSSDGATVVDDPQAPSLVERLQQFREREATVIGLTAIGVALFPWIFARAPVISDLLLGYQNLAALMLIWAIFAIGFDLLLGYTGLLSFGHAAFWGGSAYVAGIVSLRVSSDPIVMVAAGTIFAVLFAWVLGYLSLRRGGIYFSILARVRTDAILYVSRTSRAIDWW